MGRPAQGVQETETSLGLEHRAWGTGLGKCLENTASLGRGYDPGLAQLMRWVLSDR